jgi:hypothetical protein
MAAAVIASSLVGCGGGGGGSGSPAGPPAPVRSLVVQGNFNLVSVSQAAANGISYDARRHEFTTSGTGTLELNANWTFAQSQMAVVLTRGSCSFEQFEAEQCPEVGGAFPAAKPANFTFSNQPAGTYTVIIANINDYNESGTYQVFLTR